MIAGIILAAGKGTRIKSRTSNKVTLPFLSKPMILYAVELLLQVVSPVIVVVGAFAESVENVLKNYPVIFACQRKRLGTGHATKVGLQVLKRGRLTPQIVLVGYGDHMMFYPVKAAKELIDFHNKKQAQMTVVTTMVENPFGYGRVVRDIRGNVIDIVEEKDATPEQRRIKEINAGLYCFNFNFLKDNIDKIQKSPVSHEYYLPELVKITNRQSGKVAGFKVSFRDVGIGVNRPEELEESQKIYLQVKR